MAFNLKTWHGRPARESTRKMRVPQRIAAGNRFDNESRRRITSISDRGIRGVSDTKAVAPAEFRLNRKHAR
jgi:hypothetical protein